MMWLSVGVILFSREWRQGVQLAPSPASITLAAHLPLWEWTKSQNFRNETPIIVVNCKIQHVFWSSHACGWIISNIYLKKIILNYKNMSAQFYTFLYIVNPH